MGRTKDADEGKGAIKAFLKWARDENGVKKFQRELNLAQMLGTRPNSLARGSTSARRERGKGMLVCLENVLPAEVAEGAAEVARKIPLEHWSLLQGEGDRSQPAPDGILSAHRFGAIVSGEDHEGVPELLGLLGGLLPPAKKRHGAFHLGRFGKGDFLDRQDDAAYAAVMDESAEDGIVKCSRDVAVYLVLSKDRGMGAGGILRDLYHETQVATDDIQLTFNSLVAFHVPREYAVISLSISTRSAKITRVESDDPLLCAFGWFLEEGELYDLSPEAMGLGEDSHVDPTKPKKKSKKARKREERKKRLQSDPPVEADTAPPEVRRLATEREGARAAQDYGRADAIREALARQGWKAPTSSGGHDTKNGSSGNVSVGKGKGSFGGSGGADKETKRVGADAEEVAAVSGGGKKKESKMERLARQAQEATQPEQSHKKGEAAPKTASSVPDQVNGEEDEKKKTVKKKRDAEKAPADSTDESAPADTKKKRKMGPGERSAEGLLWLTGKTSLTRSEGQLDQASGAREGSSESGENARQSRQPSEAGGAADASTSQAAKRPKAKKARTQDSGTDDVGDAGKSRRERSQEKLLKRMQARGWLGSASDGMEGRPAGKRSRPRKDTAVGKGKGHA